MQNFQIFFNMNYSEIFWNLDWKYLDKYAQQFVYGLSDKDGKIVSNLKHI